ncbi:hypothetical protein [Haloarcula nitratireducens]|uniref:Uncharacterized protein n=1 Tax=Haloarcula nitratireducens TaxID=2487749 RepID=A0AAW4PKB5_9EURY|nr:hypothetical protein [Halomicroarcula nitratireducens]MBX0297657.1 hypothetical protein [Halomicroarcula nitratireducens]
MPPPTVETGDTWSLITTDSQPRLITEGSKLFINYQAVGHINRYENAQLRNRIKQNTFGEVDRPFAVSFCGRVDIFPNSVSFASDLVADVDGRMLERLKQAMSDFGVQNVTESGTQTAAGIPADLQVVEGEYQIDPVEIQGLDIPHSDTSRLEFGGGTLPIKGIVTNWKSEGSILAAGGVYPTGQFRDSHTVEMSDAINLTVNVDLSIAPNKREQQALEFIRSVSL